MAKNNVNKALKSLSCDRFRDYFYFTSIAMISLDRFGNIVDINKKACDVLLCIKGEIIGKSWFLNFLPKNKTKEVFAYFKKLISGEISLDEIHENEIVKKDGGVILARFHNNLIKEGEKINGIFFSFEDITEEKAREAKIEESEQIFRAVFENASDAIFIKDKNLNYAKVNKEAEKYLDKPASLAIGKKDKELFKADEARKINKIDAEVLAGKIFKEDKVVERGGKIKFYNIFKTPIKNDSGEIIGICGIASDISQYKNKERELNLKNKTNNDILENMPVGIYIINEKGGVDYVNKAMLKISSADYSRFMGLNLFSHKQYRKLGISEKIKNALNGEKFVLEKIQYTSTYGGKTTIRNFIGIPLEENNEKKVLMIVEDVTKHIEFEEKISGQNKFLTDIINSLSYPFYVVDTKTYKLQIANTAAMSGRNKIDFCYQVSHKSDKPCASNKNHVCPLKQVVKSKKPIMTEHVHLDKDNKRHYVEVYGYPIFGKKGEVSSMIEYSIDITDKKSAEKKIIEQEKRYSDILDNANDLIQSIDNDGRILYANKAWKNALGYDEKDLKNIKIFDIFHPDDKAHCLNEFREVLEGKEFSNLDVRFKTKKGDYIYVSGSVSCKFENGKPVSTRGIFRDVTERTKEEAELKKRTDELERFNKVAVGRELKMIELKKTIKDLEDKLNKV